MSSSLEAKYEFQRPQASAFLAGFYLCHDLSIDGGLTLGYADSEQYAQDTHFRHGRRNALFVVNVDSYEDLSYSI